MTTQEYKNSVIDAATQATAHIRHAKQAISHIHSREAALTQTQLDQAVSWLANMLTVELTEKTLIYLAGSDIDDLEYLTRQTSMPPMTIKLTDHSDATPLD